MCVSITKQDNSIISSGVKQLDEERNPLAINEVVMNEELILPTSSQQLPTSLTPIIADTNSESVIQEAQIERLSTHDKSSDLSFGERYAKPT